MNQRKYQWAAPGDSNAFFGLMLDNIAGMTVLVLLLAERGFPVDFVLGHMIPGTAIGVLVGDLLFFGLAFRYARLTGKSTVTAMPLGLDTPSTIGMALLVLGPAFDNAERALRAGGMADEAVAEAAAMQAWHIGICAILITGLIKLFMAFASGWARRAFPRAGLLGSLAAIALVLIAFTQMPKLVENSVVGFAAMVIVFETLIARGRLPFRIPGALGAVLVGCGVWYLMLAIQGMTGIDLVPAAAPESEPIWFPTQWLQAFRFEWLSAFSPSLGYLPYVAPFAIATVIGGIDCAESAASVGDDFNTTSVIGVEAIATIIAAFCGGVVQTTPYIGHPAYKAMGGRAAYTLATALFVGGAGVIGYFGLIFNWVPEAALLPILVFIGIEITAQSFHATPKRHYAALAVACMPALAKLVTIYLGQYEYLIDYQAAIDAGSMEQEKSLFLKSQIANLTILAGGFIITSLVWASALARIIDRRLGSAACYFFVGGVLVLFGVIHSPLPGDQMFLPWNLTDDSVFSAQQCHRVIQVAVAYGMMALMLWALSLVQSDKPIDSHEPFENLAQSSQHESE